MSCGKAREAVARGQGFWCEIPKATFAGVEETAVWSQLKRAVVQPRNESRPDLEIIFDLAQRLPLGEHCFDGDLEAAWNHHLEPSGLTLEQLRAHPLGIKCEAQTRFRKYAEIEAASSRGRWGRGSVPHRAQKCRVSKVLRG